jgi:DNA polymerase III subunit delta'
MSFASLIGNERNKIILKRLLERGRISSSLIFAGPDGVGKRQFALTMAKAANCRQSASESGFATDSCDQCTVCRRIEQETYGDVTRIEPDGQFIKIGQTRALIDEVFYRPREGRQRFFLIDEADRLREESANSLLKTLEEPPHTSTIILLTSRPERLLPTIRSRAQRLNFTPLSVAEIEKYLAANYPRPAADNSLLARITGGRIGQATAFDLSVYRQERRALIEMIELMTNGQDRFRLLKAAEYLGKKERVEFEKNLDLLAILLRDLFLLSIADANQEIVNIDLIEQLRVLAKRAGTARLIDWANKFAEIRAQLRININRQLATEAALLSLSKPSSP